MVHIDHMKLSIKGEEVFSHVEIAAILVTTFHPRQL